MKLFPISKSLAILSLGTLFGQQVCAQKTIMDIDIQGVKIGMSPSQATAIVDQLSTKVGSKVTVKSVQLGGSDPATGKFVPLQNGKATLRVSNGNLEMNALSTNDPDQISVNFGAVPGEERVAAIYRRAPFKEGARPLKDNVLSDIFGKYGKPILEDHGTTEVLYWAFDSKGVPLNTWAGKNCILGFPRPQTGNVMPDPTNPGISWAENIEKYWQDHSVSAYYKSCGSKQLTIQVLSTSVAGINTVYLMTFMLADIQGINEANGKANALMNVLSQNSKKEAIKNANAIKPAL
jgi:hypothetical protein